MICTSEALTSVVPNIFPSNLTEQKGSQEIFELKGVYKYQATDNSKKLIIKNRLTWASNQVFYSAVCWYRNDFVYVCMCFRRTRRTKNDTNTQVWSFSKIALSSVFLFLSFKVCFPPFPGYFKLCRWYIHRSRPNNHVSHLWHSQSKYLFQCVHMLCVCVCDNGLSFALQFVFVFAVFYFPGCWGFSNRQLHPSKLRKPVLWVQHTA